MSRGRFILVLAIAMILAIWLAYIAAEFTTRVSAEDNQEAIIVEVRVPKQQAETKSLAELEEASRKQEEIKKQAEEELRKKEEARRKKAAEIILLARVVYAEARGVRSDEQQQAVVWTILNRVDDLKFPDTIEEVVNYPNAFTVADEGYLPELDDIYGERILNNVKVAFSAWEEERLYGRISRVRILPKEYLFFYGDGELNYFYSIVEPGKIKFWNQPPIEIVYAVMEVWAKDK